MKNKSPMSLFVASEEAPNGNSYTSSLRSAMHLSAELESRPKSSRPRRDLEQHVEMRLKLKRAVTETRHRLLKSGVFKRS